MKWTANAPSPLIVTGHDVFQRGTELKIQLGRLEDGRSGELDLHLADENLIEALCERFALTNWEDAGRLLGKVFLKIVGRSPEARQVFEQGALSRIRQAIINEMGY